MTALQEWESNVGKKILFVFTMGWNVTVICLEQGKSAL